MSATIENRDFFTSTVKDVVFNISGANVSEIQRISGNSLSENHLCVCEDSSRFFVKLYCSNNSTFAIQQHLYANSVSMPIPIHEQHIGRNTYLAVYEYVTAFPVEAFPEKFSDKTLADNIAVELRKMHTLQMHRPPENIRQEILKLILYINTEGIDFYKKNEIIDYLLSNSVDVNENRVGVIHMDFHLRNVLISGEDNGRIIITDFENLSYGDIWRDFVYAALFHNQCENPLWYSIIMNYFDDSIPKQFWESVKYYCYVQVLRMIACEHMKENYSEINRLSESISTQFPIYSYCPKWFEAIKTS